MDKNFCLCIYEIYTFRFIGISSRLILFTQKKIHESISKVNRNTREICDNSYFLHVISVK